MEARMATPIEPEVCMATGRLLTEWFELPVFTDEYLLKQACAANGITPEERPDLKGMAIHENDSEQAELGRKINAFIAGRRRRKWNGSMSQVEVAHRMNEATKMVNPDNFKFLPDDVRDRTGLEINPLWMIECLIRSGVLSPKEQVAALKELAGYTHSKAPTINHNANMNVNPEAWLVELGKEEYATVEIGQPRTPAERGAGPDFEKNIERRSREVRALASHSDAAFSSLESELGAYEIEEIDWSAVPELPEDIDDTDTGDDA